MAGRSSTNDPFHNLPTTRLNDMTAKMSLVFSDQREKVDKLAVDLSRSLHKTISLHLDILM